MIQQLVEARAPDTAGSTQCPVPPPAAGRGTQLKACSPAHAMTPPLAQQWRLIRMHQVLKQARDSDHGYAEVGAGCNY